LSVCSFSSVTLEVFEYLQCVPAGDTRVVIFRPSMDCNVAAYKHRLPIAYLILVLWIVVFPLALLAFVIRLRTRKLLSTAPVLRRWGFLYATYRPRFFWYETFVLARRTCISAIAVLLLQDASSRTSALSVSLLAFLMLQVSLHPYAHRSSNIWETIALVALLLLTALTANHSILSDLSYSSTVQACASAIVILVGGTLFLQVLRRRLQQYQSIVTCEHWASRLCCFQAFKELARWLVEDQLQQAKSPQDPSSAGDDDMFSTDIGLDSDERFSSDTLLDPMSGVREVPTVNYHLLQDESKPRL